MGLAKLVRLDDRGVVEAARLIRNGGLIAYPTDTVYGLGCDPFNRGAVERLRRAKERSDRALPVLVDSIETAKRIGQLSLGARRLADKFWPGPLTIVVEAKLGLPELVTGPARTVGLRIPNRAETIRLIQASGGSLIGTSANISGNNPPRTAEETMNELGERIDMVLDGGPSTLGVESTVVRVEDGMVSILRERAIPREKILSALSPEKVAGRMVSATDD